MALLPASDLRNIILRFLGITTEFGLRILASLYLPFVACRVLGWPVDNPLQISLAGWLFSLSSWSALGLWLYLRRRRWAYQAGLLAAASLAAVGWSAQALSFYWLGHAFTLDLFFLGDVFTAADAQSYVQAFGLPALPLTCIVFGLTLAVWKPTRAIGRGFQNRRTGKVALACSLILSGWILAQSCFVTESTDHFAGTELETAKVLTETAVLAVGTGILRIGTTGHYFSLEGRIKRMRPAAVSLPPPDFDILLIVHESLSNWNWPHFMPRIHATIIRREGIIFKEAYTPSASTTTGMKAFLTGLHPIAGHTPRRQYPLLWQWGKAAGMHTILGFNRWMKPSLDLGRFMLSPGPDRLASRETMPPEVTRRLSFYEGELYLLEDLLRAIRESPPDKPLLTVWHSLAMHLPCQGDSPLLAEPLPGDTPCERAAHLVDYGTSLLLDELQAAGRLDRTLVAITADHGEYRDGVRPPDVPPKQVNWRNEVMKVPLFMWLPDAWYEERPDVVRLLKLNALRRVSTLDVPRTLISLMNGGRVQRIDGAPPKRLDFPETVDLANEIVPERRWIVSSNQDSFLIDLPDGFMLLGTDWKVAYNEKEGLWVQDNLLDDSGTKTDWKQVPASLKEALCPALLARPVFVRMVEKSSFGARYGSGLGCLPPEP